MTITVELPQLSHSRLRCYNECPRKYEYRYQRGIVPDREPEPLRFGSAVHLGLEKLGDGHSIEAVACMIREAYAALPAWCVSDAAITKWFVEQETVVELLYAYQSCWRHASDPGITIDDVIATELWFELPIGSTRTAPFSVYCGRIDMIARLADGRLAIVEHKTTSAAIDPASDYWSRLRIDAQISGYYLAARSMGYDVDTVLYDVIRKPSIRPKKVTKADAAGGTYYGRDVPVLCAGEPETPRMYAARLARDIADRPDWYFARQDVPRLMRDIDEFERDLQAQADHIKRSWVDQRWPRHTNACVGIGKCEYLPVCHTLTVANDVPLGYVVRDTNHTAQQETQS